MMPDAQAAHRGLRVLTAHPPLARQTRTAGVHDLVRRGGSAGDLTAANDNARPAAPHAAPPVAP